MKKLFIPLCLILLLTACSCKHEWMPATCTESQTCEKCGTVEGEALGHSWTEATCTEPETCQNCGETKGNALGHSSGAESVAAVLNDPNAVNAIISSGVDLDQLGESFEKKIKEYPEPTCTTAGRCDRCKEDLPPLGHSFSGGKCLRCGLETAQ